jgi:hypothetical protein
VSPSGNTAGALFAGVATEQLSVALAVPRATPLALQNPASVPTIRFDGQTIVGASESMTVTVNEPDALLPDPSRAVYVTVVLPTAK